jgi:hypothetical protein
MATTKKPTTTKKPAAKKTAVVKAHRGMAHVPRGRRRPIGTPQLPRNPRRRPPNLQVEPRRLGDDRPRGGQQMTPAMRRRLMELRRRAQQRRQLPPQGLGGLSRSTPAQQKAARDRFIKMQEANKKMRANVFGRRRKPTQATQTPKVATPRKRPTGTPRGPQVTPRKRNFRFRGRR